jgi:hypothetical protein
VIGMDGAVTGHRYAVVVCHAERSAPGSPAVVVLDRLLPLCEVRRTSG